MTKLKDTMRPEYDMTDGVRGKYAGRFPKDVFGRGIGADVDSFRSGLGYSGHNRAFY